VAGHRADKVVRPGRVREPGAEKQRLRLLRGPTRELRGRAGRDDAGLRLGEREEGDVRILPRDRLDDRPRGGHRHDARAAPQRRSRREEQGTGVAERTADDEDAAARLLPRVGRERLHGRAHDARRERARGGRAQRRPTATATARSLMCEIDTESGSRRPMACRRASAPPWSVTVGCPARVRLISISRQPTPRTPRPSTFDTASFAAQRPERWRMFERQYICSHSVYTRSKKRRGCRSSTWRIRAVSMMSMPTSEGSLTQGLRGRRDGWHGGAGVARDARVPRGPIREERAGCRDGRGWGGCASARPPDPGTGPVAPRHESFDRHGFRE